MTAPAPGLPEDVGSRFVYVEGRGILVDGVVEPFRVGDEILILARVRGVEGSDVTPVKAILLYAGCHAMRAATAGSGAASAASAASAAHVAPGGEPVAWAVVSEPIGLFSIIFDEGTTQIRYGGKPEADKTAAQLNADEMRGHPFTVAPLFTRPAPPVSASFEESLTGLDVEPTHHPDKMITTHTILGLDDVRAAHRAEVDALRDAIALVRVNIAHERGCSHLLCIPTCAHAILDAAIRARGVAKPRTDGEAATRSGEEAKS